jgi:hypothetical protein
MSWVAAERLASIGPVVAVGEPGEELPPLGPYRLFLPAGNWQGEVERLIASARAVFLVLGRSKGVLWELERILARENPGGVTVIVPPAEPGDLEQRWEAFLALAKNHPVWRRRSTSIPRPSCSYARWMAGRSSRSPRRVRTERHTRWRSASALPWRQGRCSLRCRDWLQSVEMTSVAYACCTITILVARPQS